MLLVCQLPLTTQHTIYLIRVSEQNDHISDKRDCIISTVAVARRTLKWQIYKREITSLSVEHSLLGLCTLVYLPRTNDG